MQLGDRHGGVNQAAAAAASYTANSVGYDRLHMESRLCVYFLGDILGMEDNMMTKLTYVLCDLSTRRSFE